MNAFSVTPIASAGTAELEAVLERAVTVVKTAA